ncbi:aromatic ring-opening dioxygenase LigA [Protaetiibacter intestinalis]|uniref:Aromatic ring-opening dioxygenase LigA n=1 Tax=Protaetiibacter intestinalis TaxID=2419774 RepID=A0A387B5H3_9MICO|nr:aromatic ring-opening dioxygenase LigA [Protaetiibacter intestinalis]AYF96988.1 aromatic ring-opening dioxygenase LigA [Protaetiibacter intestinalis]
MSAQSTTVVLPARAAGLARLTGLAGILGGILLIITAAAVWITVSTELRAENIVIPDDAIAFQGKVVDGPIDALIQAEIIREHALDASDGKTYAELDREDPLRATVMNASFLRTSLFTSVVSFGVALLAAGVGVLFILFGLSLRAVVPSPRKAAAPVAPATDV